MKKIIIVLTALLFAFPVFSQEADKQNSTEAPSYKVYQASEYPDFVTFMNMYNESTYSSQKKLTLMHKSSNLSKLGKEKIKGDISGSLSYNATISGLSGVVYMDYENYCDFPGWILNGSTNTKANIWSNGKMFSHVEVSGSYSAKIYYDNLKIEDGKAGGGFYIVEYADGRQGLVAWNAIKQFPPIKK